MSTGEPRQKSLSMSVLTTPDMVNFAGSVHGGVMLKMIDEAAYVCAARYAGCEVVTLALDQVIFKQPVYIGELVSFLATVNYTGRTSMEVGVKVVAENFKERHVRHTITCYVTMVALDEEGRPTPVPPLEPAGEEERRRCEEARLRRAFRAEVETRQRSIHPGAEPQ